MRVQSVEPASKFACNLKRNSVVVNIVEKTYLSTQGVYASIFVTVIKSIISVLTGNDAPVRASANSSIALLAK